MARALALGFLIGFPIAASPGPIFFLVLRRTLSRGWRSGLVGGLGVATGDAIYAGLAAFGVAAVTNVLLGQRRWIGLVGGVAIALIGVRTIRSDPYPGSPPQEGNQIGGLAMQYGSMVALTLGNPATILSFIAVFAGFELRIGSGWLAVALVVGVMLGSTLWWLGLTAAVWVIRQRLTLGIARGVGVVAGLALIGFGTVAAASSLVRPG
jgi:threonine/homoserine/homoserine lactone efflux protein